MENIKNRLVAIIVLLVGFYIIQLKVSYGEYTQGLNQDIFETFPMKINEWDGSRIPFGENVYNILETEAVVVNKYVNGNKIVNLSMVYYPDAKVDFHSPEGCSTGAGDKIQKLTKKKINVIADNKLFEFYVNVFIVYNASGSKIMYYYMYKSGDYIGSSYIRLRLNMAKYYFTERRTNGALIVFSSPVYQSNEDSEKILYDFIESSYPIINKYV